MKVKTYSLSIIVFFLFSFEAFPMFQGKTGLKVGAAKVELTPIDHLRAPATGKYDHERNYVRAIVLNNGATNAALISLETVLNQSNWDYVFEKITEELDCPVGNIIVAATHAHSVQMSSPNSEPDEIIPFPLSEEGFRSIADRMVEAVRQAKAKLQPARVGFGTGMSYLNVNRDGIDPKTRQWTQMANLDGWSDKSVDVIKFETTDGKPIAVYMNYAIHPVNGWVLRTYSADIPGAVSRYVEKAFNDEIIVAFSQGACGDQNPLYLRPSSNAMASRTGIEITGYELNREKAEGPIRGELNSVNPVDPEVLDNLFRFIESQGQVLGEEVIRVMSIMKRMDENVRIEGKEKTVTLPGRKRINGDGLDPATREGIRGSYEDGPDIKIKLGMLGIGTTAIVRVNAEIFSFIGQRVKNESALRNTMVVSIANGRGTGYIPNDAAYGEETYEVLACQIKPGFAEEAIVNTLTEMITEYLDN